ncbi:hypothetical protein HRbin16_00839 [bacterium HR16]|nr:hypothetical protein HRbin16_00839 [bacterium HR16]
MLRDTFREGRHAAGSEPLLGVIATPVKTASERVNDAAAMVRAGVRWVQLDIPLSRINPRAGEFRWDYGDYQAGLRVFARAGVSPVLKFLGQADYLSQDPAGPHADWDRTLNLTPPRDRQQWQDVVRRVVAQYAPYCRHWQIGNEPDGGGYFRGSAEEYMQYLEWTATAIRSVQPHAVILGGELFRGQMGLGSYGDVLSQLVRRPDLFDVLSIHYPLSRPQDAGPVEDYRRAMQQASIRKPLWNTEQQASASCEHAAPGTTTHIRTEGAARLSPLKAIGHCVALGIEKVFLFSWDYDDGGLAYRHDLRRECLVAAQALHGAVPLRRPDFGQRDLTLYLFRKPDGTRTLAFWTEVKGVTARLVIQTSRAVRVVNHRGETQTLQPVQGSVRITAEFCPKVATGLEATAKVRLG